MTPTGKTAPSKVNLERVEHSKVIDVYKNIFHLAYVFPSFLHNYIEGAVPVEYAHFSILLSPGIVSYIIFCFKVDIWLYF